MKRYVIDTNVPVIANGRSEDGRKVALACRQAAIMLLMRVIEQGVVLLDLEGDISDEYRRHLRPAGQPGVGDRFYQHVLRSGLRVRRFSLPKLASGEYADLPDQIAASGFDLSDRKFAALAFQQKAPVVNATDSDWANFKTLIRANGIRVQFICGCDPSDWFAS